MKKVKRLIPAAVTPGVQSQVDSSRHKTPPLPLVSSAPVVPATTKLLSTNESPENPNFPNLESTQIYCHK
jgi:hypothetical protein